LQQGIFCPRHILLPDAYRNIRIKANWEIRQLNPNVQPQLKLSLEKVKIIAAFPPQRLKNHTAARNMLRLLT
jgi:hypothetical protein